MAPVVEISAVLVSYNTERLLYECVERLRAALAGLTHEIIVVDNASPDGSADMVRRRLQDTQLIANHENLFYTRAANQGLRMARGGYVLIVNPDVLFAEATFHRMFTYLQSHPEVGAVSPALVDGTGIPEACFCRRRSFESFLLNYSFLRHLFPGRTERINAHIRMEGASRTDVREVEVVVDMSLLVRHEALQQIGFFDEGFKLYFCDDDLSIRLRAAGWKVMFLGDVANRHDRHQSVGQRSELWRAGVFREDAFTYARKHFGVLRAIVLWPLMRVTTTLRAVRLKFRLAEG